MFEPAEGVVSVKIQLIQCYLFPLQSILPVILLLPEDSLSSLTLPLDFLRLLPEEEVPRAALFLGDGEGLPMNMAS